MARTVRNNPPRPHPRDANHHRSRETGRDSQSSRNSSRTNQSRQADHAEGSAAQHSSPRSPDALLAEGLVLPRQRGRRYDRQLMRDLRQRLLELQADPVEDSDSPEPPRRPRGRRPPTMPREAAWPSGDFDTVAQSSFEQARDAFIAQIDIEVMANMDESVAAVREVIEEITRRSDAGPGLVPDDIILMMRGVYAVPAMVLAQCPAYLVPPPRPHVWAQFI